jgi:ribokinase
MTGVHARVALVGYASVDHPMQLAGQFRSHWTTPIRHRGSGPWPRPGGCHFYAGMPVARTGADTALVTWIGDDALGEQYRGHCVAQGMSDAGMAIVESGNTPLCFLVYEDDGACACLIDFGLAGREEVTQAQAAVLAAADFVCMTVAPPRAAEQALSLTRPDAIIAWVTKNDPASFPTQFRAALAQRARYIFCNARELAWVDEALDGDRGDRIIIQTNGAEQVLVHERTSTTAITVQPIDARDTTGAGDTLAGGTLAALIAGETDIRRAVEAGVSAAADLLRPRSGL